MNIPPAISCTSSVLSPESAPQAISVPSEFSTCPFEPSAKAAGFPEESPYIILPHARPANFANVTASSLIFAVSTALSAKCATVIIF